MGGSALLCLKVREAAELEERIADLERRLGIEEGDR